MPPRSFVVLLALLTACDTPGTGTGNTCAGGECVCTGEDCVCVTEVDCDITCGTGGAACGVDCVSGSTCDVDCSSASACGVDCTGATTCGVVCAPGSDCDVECRETEGCVVDCGTAASCTVFCPAEVCTVHNCDMLSGVCAVACGTNVPSDITSTTITCP